MAELGILEVSRAQAGTVEVRNPKAEIRKKPEIRNPKVSNPGPEARSSRVVALAGKRAPAAHLEEGKSCCSRVSGFGSRPSGLPAARVAHHVEIAHVEVDDAVGDHQHNAEIEGARRPPAERMELARALLLVIGVQAPQGVVKLSTDFAGRVLAGKEFRKEARSADR